MKKKIFVFVLLMIMVIAAGCAQNKEINKNDKALTEEKIEEIVEIPISEVENTGGLTKEEAEKLCIDVLGDKAEENGFPISYKCIGAVSAGGKSYYVMNMAWLVEGHHWSYIGNCYVSSDGREIYDGIATGETYEITSLRWEK